MDTYDSAYRQLFSHQEIVRDLLSGFVPFDWVQELDLASLEKVSGSLVSDDLRSRSSDVIWRVRWGQDWLYIYLLLEFQSSVDHFMAVRLQTYIGLLYQDLVRTRQLDSGMLPPVLPVVLYNGTPRWRAATDLSELIHPGPESLRLFRPALRYLLLDEGAWEDRDLPASNLVAAIFRLENSRTPEAMQKVVGLLVDWLTDPEQEPLRRSLTEWLRRVVLPRRVPEGTIFPEIHSLQEMHNMLAERVKEWQEEYKQKGLAQGLAEGLAEGRAEGRARGLLEGRQEGRQEGRLEGERELFQRLLRRRFGAAAGQFDTRIAEASVEQLDVWADRLLDANTVEDIFAPTPSASSND